MNEVSIEGKGCAFDRQKFLEYLNIIRDKHNLTEIIWDSTLESQAKIYTNKLKNDNKCIYKKRLAYSELFTSGSERLTEKQILDKWYAPAYDYDFENVLFRYPLLNGYSIFVMLWDSVDKVGCAKSCCSGAEVVVCDFLPTIVEPKAIEIKAHVRPNKYFIK
jgi:hypothetical protein